MNTTAIVTHVLAYLAGIGTVLFFVRKRGAAQVEQAAQVVGDAANTAGAAIREAERKASTR